MRYVHRSPRAEVVIALLGCLTAGIIEGPRTGWGSAPIAVLFAVAVLAAVALAVIEPRRREPLVDIRYFRSAPFSGAALIGVVALAALGGFLFLNTLYLQDVRGYSALQALREIAAAVDVDPSAATVGVNQLEAQGLVRRAAHPEDNRRKLVHLTDAGRDAARRAQAILAEPPAELSGRAR
jgi:hypothetical protein